MVLIGLLFMNALLWQCFCWTETVAMRKIPIVQKKCATCPLVILSPFGLVGFLLGVGDTVVALETDLVEQAGREGGVER